MERKTASPSVLQMRHSLTNAWCAQSLSCAQLFTTSWAAAFQAPPSMRFSLNSAWCAQSLSCAQLFTTSWAVATMATARLLCPWDFSDKNTGVGCHFLLQGIFLTQGLNLGLLHQQADSIPLNHLGSQSSLSTRTTHFI